MCDDQYIFSAELAKYDNKEDGNLAEVTPGVDGFIWSYYRITVD